MTKPSRYAVVLLGDEMKEVSREIAKKRLPVIGMLFLFSVAIALIFKYGGGLPLKQAYNLALNIIGPFVILLLLVYYVFTDREARRIERLAEKLGKPKKAITKEEEDAILSELNKPLSIGFAIQIVLGIALVIVSSMYNRTGVMSILMTLFYIISSCIFSVVAYIGIYLYDLTREIRVRLEQKLSEGKQ